jgi:CheY-like chemotaxis protein
MKAKKILIVEDDVFSRGVMEKVLESYNYETFSCALAEDAIARLKQEPFNILITDLHMPGMDGFELIRKARMIHPELLTILVTGFPTEEIKNKVREIGLNGFLAKPIDWSKLHNLLLSLSGSQEAQSRNIGGCTRDQRREYSSRKIVFAFIFFLMTAFGVQPLGAQRTFSPPQKRTEGQGAFWHSPSLGLTEAQTKELENIKQAFIEEAAPLWRELRALNLELRYLISDPNVKPQTLFDRQRRISELRVKLESLLLSSQVKARSVLTKEQFDRLSRDCTLGMGTIYEAEIGIDRRLQKGVRY